MNLLVVAAAAGWTLYGPNPTHVPKSVHLADMLGYSDCTISNAPLLDDGRTDAAQIATALAEKCSVAYRKWLAVVTAGAKSQGVLSNYDMALHTVEMERRAPKATQ